jgi:hypothetical protein
MPTWTIENDGTNVALTYEDGQVTKDCGTGPANLEADVEGFAVDQATPGDRIRTRRGLFVRQPAPIGTN